MMMADGCDGLPNEAEASLSWAFRTNKHRASLKAEWQDDEHASDGLPRIICQSACSRTAPSAATEATPTSPPYLRTPSPLPTHPSKRLSPFCNSVHARSQQNAHKCMSTHFQWLLSIHTQKARFLKDIFFKCLRFY